MNYNWNWNIFWAPAPDGTGVYFWWLITGLGWTLSTALLAWAIALTLGDKFWWPSSLSKPRERSGNSPA